MTSKSTGVGTALRCGAIAVGVAIGMPAVQAQQAPPTPAQAAGAQQAGPPVVRFAPGGISLDEAVRLALEHGPFIQRSEADSAFRAGVAQQRSGLFDTTLLGTVSFSHRVQELTDSRKEEEQKKRDDLQQVVDQGPAILANAQQANSLLQGIRNGTVVPSSLASISPTLSATLQYIDAMIATSTPPVRNQLINIRNGILDNAIASAQAQLNDLQSIFDRSRQGLIDLGPAPDDEYFRDLNTNVQVSKMLRSGISFGPFFGSDYSSTNYVGKPRDANFGGKGLEDLYTFRAGVGAVLPLARGRGSASVAAPERAARVEYEASLLTLEHERATTALETVVAYWQLRAAQDTVDVATRSLAFQDQLVGAIQQLVTGGSLAGVELTRAQAAQARARADLDEARRRLTDARVKLALAMGVVSTDDDQTLPLAGEPFPAMPPAPGAASPLVSQALAQRPDLGAATQLEDAGRILAEGARGDTRARLDLTVSAWFTALDEGTAAEAVDRWVGPSASVDLQFEKPLGNNVRLGLLAQREAEARRRGIDQRDLARQIQLKVIQSARTVQDARARVEQAQAAVDFYQTTIDAEFARLQGGNSTVLDTVITQQQQNGALLGLVAAQLDLALRMAELRFETGTLISGAGLSTEAPPVPGSTGAGGR